MKAYNNIKNVIQLMYICRGTRYILMRYIRRIKYIQYMYILLNGLHTIIVY